MKKIFLSLFFVVGFLVSLGSTSSVSAASIDITNSNDPTVEISDPMSAEEIIRDYADNQDVTYDEAENALFPEGSSMSTYDISPYAINYRTLKKTLPNSAGFVYFYCQTDESSGSFRAINKIMNAGYSSGSKIYAGSFYYHLPDPNKINFILNGHLYNTGTTTTSGSGSVTVGKSFTGTIGISNTSSYYKALYFNSSLTF